MANALYPDFKRALLNKEHNLDTDNIKATLIDLADYTYAATDTTYVAGVNGVADAAKVAASAALSNTTIAAGVFDSDNFTWSSVTGDVSEAIILWNDSHASDALVAYYDTGVTGFPITPNGGDLVVTVSGSGWFSL